MKKIIIIIIASIVFVIISVISISKTNNISRRNTLEVNNNQEDVKDVKDFKEADQLETEQNFELENNELNVNLEKKDTQGEVTVTVTFLNPTLQDEDYLNFEVYLNTHSVELDKYNLEEMTNLFIGSKTQIMKGILWETGGGGHHISGTLKVPREYKGEKINYIEADFIELEVKNLGEIDSRKFKWEKEEFNLKKIVK